MFEGHIAAECSMNRVLAPVAGLEISSDDAWVQLKNADEKKEIEDIKQVDNQPHPKRSTSILT
jgi:hypothetical protein